MVFAMLGGVALFARFQAPRMSDIAQLRGRDLACWCRLDAPCHADVLLELANKPIASKRSITVEMLELKSFSKPATIRITANATRHARSELSR